MLGDSFDVRDTHTLGFIRKYHYEVYLLTQKVDPPPFVPTKGNLKPLVIQACLRHPCIPAPREMWLCFAGFEPAIYCLKWDMCPSYPDSTWQTGQDDVPPHHPTMAVFIVPPALSWP